MLLKIAIEPNIFQVRDDEGHPEHDVFGALYCPVCGSYLHGHGWRKRSHFDDSGHGIEIWVHRCLCPRCRKSYTVLPEGVAVLKRYSLETVRRMLRHRAMSGFFSGKGEVPRFLQRSWWKRFTDRIRAGPQLPATDVALSKIIALGQVVASPLGITSLENREDLVAWWHSSPPSHHRLPVLVTARMLYAPP